MGQMERPYSTELMRQDLYPDKQRQLQTNGMALQNSQTGKRVQQCK